MNNLELYPMRMRSIRSYNKVLDASSMTVIFVMVISKKQEQTPTSILSAALERTRF